MALVLCFAFVTSFGSTVKADEKEEKFTERIQGVQFDIPHNESEVYVEKETDGLVGTIKVYDNETDELLDTFKVEDEERINRLDYRPYNTTLRNVSRTRKDNKLESQLRIRMEVYSSGSFRQINEIVNTQWFASSGRHTIENSSANTVSTTGKFPTESVRALGDATIQIKTTEDFSAGWEAAGFSIGSTSGTTNYFRKYIELGFTYSLY